MKSLTLGPELENSQDPEEARLLVLWWHRIDHPHPPLPSWWARSLGVYRFGRDLGFAIGALSAGAVADTFRLVWAIKLAAVLSLISGEAVGVVMRQTENR